MSVKKGAVVNQGLIGNYLDFRIFGALVLLCIGLYIGLVNPWLPALSIQGHRVIMALIIVLGLWIFKPADIPFSAGGFLLMMLFLVVGVKPTDVFSGFTSNATWVLIPALFFGFVLIKTGLGRRVAFQIISIFKPSLGGMIIAWIIIGFVLAILTPSITVRTSIVMPIAFSCVQTLKYAEGSRERALLMMTTFAMGMLPGSGWLTGSLTGPITMGLYESVPALQGLITFDSYLKVVFIPIEISCLILVFLGWVVFKPKNPISISREEFRQEFNKLPPLSRQEIFVGVILVSAFIMFFTASMHHIPEPAICLGAVFLFCLTGIIKTADISKGISWDLATFIGISISLGAVFSSTGVSSWFSTIIVPAMKPFATNPWVFVICVTTILFAWRFVDVARFLPTLAVLVPILPQIALIYGINPLIWVAITTMAINCFFMNYQNIWALQAEALLPEKSWTPGQIAKYGTLYFASCLIALLVTVPYWMSIGLFTQVSH